MKNSDMVSNQKNLNVLEDFSMKATKCMTHKKASKIKNETTKFVPSITPSRKKTFFDQFKFHTRNFTVRTVDFIQNIEQYLILVEAEIEDLRVSFMLSRDYFLEEIQII